MFFQLNKIIFHKGRLGFNQNNTAGNPTVVKPVISQAWQSVLFALVIYFYNDNVFTLLLG